MFKKVMKTILSLSMCASLFPVTSLTVNAKEVENLALNATATASEQETNYWGPDKTVDGIINRDAEKPQQSRWGTDQLNGTESVWLKLDLKEEKTFQNVVLSWERTNIDHYTIETSNTGNDDDWDVVYDKPNSNNITSLDEVIHLDAPVSAQYVRLVVDGYDGGDLNWKSVSLYEIQLFEDAVPVEYLSDRNYSLDATAEVSDFEQATKDQSGAMAIDGDKNTRWATNPSTAKEPRVLTLTLPEAQFITCYRIFWERLNIDSYKIEISADGNDFEEVYRKDTPITEIEETIKVDGNWAKKVRLTVDGYNEGEITGWPNVSVAEFETYSKEPGAISEDATAKEIADSLPAPVVNEDASALVFPTLPEGVDVVFNADYEQVVAKDGTIYQPLTEKTIVGVYKVTKDGETAESFKEHTIVIPGKYENAGGNEKPVVVPELAEWHGAESGAFTVTADTNIVYDANAVDVVKNAAEAFQKDFEANTNMLLEVKAGTPEAGDIYFTLSSDNMMGDEGYTMEIGDVLTVAATHNTGAYWATRSMLQILELNDNSIPCGETRDYPKFKVRSFSLDVARKPVSMKTLQDMTKYMAYYKMNDFQVHLNDNLIFYEDYASVEEAMAKAYTGFRLESDIKAGQVIEGDSKGVKNVEDLTNTDLYYTKEDFRNFILDSRAMGINIVPEFDAPGHSGAFMDVRPDLHLKKTIEGNAKRAGEQFDLSDEHYADSLNFVKKLWDEYLNEDMFDSSMVVHVGTDEYYGAAEGFRKFSDDILAHVQKTNPVVRMWGSLSHKNGTTPVRSENVQMNVWYNAYAKPMDMYNQGYQLINTNDGTLYIVPGAGYYNDYLNTSNIYRNWKPNNIAGVYFPAGSDQMLGSTFAIWNDSIDTRANGISEVDIYDRFADAVPAMASKNWGDAKDISYEDMRATTKQLSDAPGTNPYDKASSVDGTYMDYEFEEGKTKEDASNNERDLLEDKNVSFDNGKLQLNGDESYVTTPLNKLASGNTLEFDITVKDALEPGDILFEADTEGNELYSHDIRIMDDGTLGFTRELYDYSFGYVLPENQTTHIVITTNGGKTTLYADNEVYPASGKYVDDEGITKKEGIANASLNLPLQRIGSKSNAATCVIDNVSVVEGVYEDKTIIDSSDFVVTSDNENPAVGKEGPISYAFDNDESTFWHSNYTPYQELPATVEIDMNKEYTINKFSYLPRQSGTNGIITEYSLYYKLNADDEWTPIIEDGSWESNSSLKSVKFDAVNARYLKFVATDGASDSTKKFASAAEFKIHQKVETPSVDKSELEAVVTEAEKLNADDYTAASWEAFETALNEAKAVLEKEATQEEVATATKALTDAMNALEMAEVSKAILEYTITLAEKISEEDLEGCVDAVVEYFNKALANAKEVYEDEKATKAEVTEAWTTLFDAMHKLDWKKADVSDLKDFVAYADTLVKEDYYESGWAKFEEALAAAKELIADGNNMDQEAVNEALQELMEAASELRNIPDKSELEDLITKVEGMKAEDYTAESWAAVETALANAKAVYNAESEEAEVKAAQEALNAAIKGLEPVTTDSEEDKKPGEDGEGPDSGDSTNVGGLLTLLGLAGMAIAYETRKRMR